MNIPATQSDHILDTLQKNSLEEPCKIVYQFLITTARI